MTEASSCLTFSLKTAQPLRVCTHFWRQNLYRDAIAKQDVTREIYGTHTALAQQRFHLILAI